MATQLATFGGGCFWCIEAVFQEVKGVSKVVSGYTGGQTLNPTYRAVCGGETGHAEVIQVTFDTTVVTYEQLLAVFFTVHDPTTLNRQGADVGTQYRSAIFTHTTEQEQTAKLFIQALNSQQVFARPIVTEVTPIPTFYPAEDYHQKYFENNPNQPYCQLVAAPKVKKFFEKFGATLGKRAV